MSQYSWLPRFVFWGLRLATLAAIGQLVSADDDSNSEPSTLRELIDATVDDVQVFSGVDAPEPAKPLVALRWANNPIKPHFSVVKPLPPELANIKNR